MNIIWLISIILIALSLFLVFSGSEGYPTTTYVNTPLVDGIYPTNPYGNWGGNYYDRLYWQPWGYHRPNWYDRWGPVFGGVNQAYVRPTLANVGRNPGAPIPSGNPIPVDSLRWRGMFGPMLTSIKSPKDYFLGQWVHAGTAYTDNPNDFTYLQIEQLNLDPGRDLFSYRARSSDGTVIPITLKPYHDRLEDGDRFKIQGMEAKGDFIFTEADKYSYVYT